MKLIAFTACLALMFAAPVAWSDPTSGTATPQKMKLAQKLIEASGGQERATTTIRMMMGTIYKGLEKNMPPDRARLTDAMQTVFQQEMIGIVPDLVQISERIYAENLTEKEMSDELAWLNSESGRSIQQKSPQMVQQMAAAEVPVIQAMMPRLSQQIIDRVCAEAKCSEQDRQIVTAAMAKAMATHPG